MPPWIDILSGVMILAGCLFVLVGAIGLVRMPDLYTRMHAVSVMETLGAGLLLGGLMVQAGLTLVTVKLLIILGIFFFVGPVASHAVALVASHEGVEPLLAEDHRREKHTGATPSPAAKQEGP